ncbi:DUF1972 domain-containing protein [Anditalea andensis]|uniref:Glycosyl transferase n=1 Tax=Anditalea andensis TaxID=1048983 RepID=A0A074KUK6_9BACT|nr:DUF1972 domain-containing protein [Anditalea andensis]KEO73636.1 glycosyl transferase [Anditalea andensis]
MKDNRKTRVAILGSRGYPYVYSGYETLVKEISERMVQRGLDVTVYCHASLFDKKPVTVKDIRLVYIPAIETKSLTQLTHTFLSMIHACFKRYDVILMVNSGNGPFGLLSRIFQIPTAINLDGLEWDRPKWKGLGAKYFKLASKLATKLYDVLITDSYEMEKIYKELFNKNSTVIAYGAYPSIKSNYTKIQRWNLVPESYFLIVGRLVPDNNADLIIEGFVKSNSCRKLVIVGDVPYQDAYSEKVKSIQDERLLFTGYVTDPEELAALYHDCFAYFHGHEYGGTNPTMLKAMGYGCAILALDTRFNREMLQNGKHGWYFQKNKLSIKDVVERAETNTTDIHKLRITAREGLTKMYDWDHVTDQYVEVFERLAKKKNTFT